MESALRGELGSRRTDMERMGETEAFDSLLDRLMEYLGEAERALARSAPGPDSPVELVRTSRDLVEILRSRVHREIGRLAPMLDPDLMAYLIRADGPEDPTPGPDAHPARGHRPLRGPPRLLGAVRAHSPGGPGAPAEPLSGARMGLHTGRGRRGGSIYGGCGAGLVQRSLRAAGPSVSGPAGGVADAAGGAPSARRAPPGAPPTLPHRRAPRRGGPRADRNP